MLDRYDACSSLELADIHQNGTETAAPGVLIDYQWKIATVLGPPAITPCPMSPLPLQRGAILWGGGPPPPSSLLPPIPSPKLLEDRPVARLLHALVIGHSSMLDAYPTPSFATAALITAALAAFFMTAFTLLAQYLPILTAARTRVDLTALREFVSFAWTALVT